MPIETIPAGCPINLSNSPYHELEGQKTKPPQVCRLWGLLLSRRTEITKGTCVNFITKNILKVEGKMSEKAADLYGKMVASAVLILASGIAIAAIIYAIRWW